MYVLKRQLLFCLEWQKMGEKSWRREGETERTGLYYIRITNSSLGKVSASTVSTVAIDSVILKLI